MQTAATQPVDVSSLPAYVRWPHALRSLARLLAHPDETEVVLDFTTWANAGSTPRRIATFYDDPRGRALFAAKRAIDSKTVDLDALAALPEGTLGHAYAHFMKQHGLTPDVFDGPPDGISDPQVSYVMQRFRQTHDLWHVVTNAETDPAGEVALQAFTYAQTGAPGSAIIAALGMLKTLVKSDQHARIVREVFAMMRLGRRADRLGVFAWEDHWATPLDEVRRMLKLPEDPSPIGGYTSLTFAAAS